MSANWSATSYSELAISVSVIASPRRSFCRNDSTASSLWRLVLIVVVEQQHRQFVQRQLGRRPVAVVPAIAAKLAIVVFVLLQFERHPQLERAATATRSPRC